MVTAVACVMGCVGTTEESQQALNAAQAKYPIMLLSTGGGSSLGGRGPQPPPVPEGMTPQDFGKLLKWGSGSDAARAQIGQLTREVLEKAGVTREMAQQWASFYKEISKLSSSNPSAPGRADLMSHVADLFK